MIFDTHAHYDDEKFDEDREQVLMGLASEGISTVVNVGASVRGCYASVELSKEYDFVYAAVGVHPDNAKDLDEKVFEDISTLCDDEKCVAVGEIGLDYYWDSTDPGTQKKWFVRQLELAKMKNKPIIIHSRDACEDTMEILKEFHKNPHPQVVIHCFSYSPEIGREYIKMGFYIGVGGVVTFTNGKKLQQTVAETPIEKILLETDCPYLSPVPFRGKRNSSANLKYVVDKIAEIKGLTADEVIRITEENARRFYGISC